MQNILNATLGTETLQTPEAANMSSNDTKGTRDTTHYSHTEDSKDARGTNNKYERH